jgi:hypothetical protein
LSIILPNLLSLKKLMVMLVQAFGLALNKKINAKGAKGAKEVW